MIETPSRYTVYYDAPVTIVHARSTCPVSTASACSSAGPGVTAVAETAPITKNEDIIKRRAAAKATPLAPRSPHSPARPHSFVWLMWPTSIPLNRRSPTLQRCAAWRSSVNTRTLMGVSAPLRPMSELTQPVCELQHQTAARRQVTPVCRTFLLPCLKTQCREQVRIRIHHLTRSGVRRLTHREYVILTDQRRQGVLCAALWVVVVETMVAAPARARARWREAIDGRVICSHLPRVGKKRPWAGAPSRGGTGPRTCG